MFLVLEGVDGGGKTTQIARVAARLRSRGRDVVETFEPGATQLGAALRGILLDSPTPVAPLTEALLLAADRAQHVAEVVQPALARGADVVSDRHVPSSLAYQGIARGLGVEPVESLSLVAVDGLEPDLVVVLDLPAPEAATRRDDGDRLEAEPAEFHEKVRRAYLELAAERGWPVVDGTADRDTVTDRIMDLLDAASTSADGHR